MKKYKNKLLAVLISMVTLFSFTSCETDYYWIATVLNFELEVPVRSDGYFEQTVRIYDTDIPDYLPSRQDLVDIRTLDSWLVLSNLTQRDRITLSIEVNRGALVYDHRLTISPNYNNEYIIDNDGFFNFMSDAIDIIRRRGYADFTVIGKSNISDGGPIVFSFGNNIDIYVRE